MLVTFKCKDYAHITLFGDIAQQLLRMMGHSGTVPSAIAAKDVPAALAHLKSAIAKIKPASPSQNTQDDDFNEQSVSLANRALPLIELLTFAAKENYDVMWEQGT